MNPFFNSEMADYQLRKLLEEKQVAEQEFHEAMEVLSKASKDFSESGQKHFIDALRDARILRDHLWSVCRDIDNLKP